MRSRLTMLPGLALALALASCAGPARQTPTPPPQGPPPTAAKPEPKKPVRMNGRGELATISLEDFFALQQSGKTLIFDARAAFFYQLGHIPEAINLPKNHCDQSIVARESAIQSALAAGKILVVYCSSITCPDARTVAIHLAGFGYPVKIFTGGWEAWKQADLPGA